jgi:hypothetical protein
MFKHSTRRKWQRRKDRKETKMKTTHTGTSLKQKNCSIHPSELNQSGVKKMKKILMSFILTLAAMVPQWAQAAAPVVNNTNGASSVLSISATLNGTLTSTGGVPTQVYVYWGTTDGGTTFGSWGNTNDLGTNGTGLLSLAATNLTPNRTYYYRFFATNADGSAWAVATTNFKTLAASGPLAVNLGSTAHFTILAGAAVTAGPGIINGDVGASPIAGSAIGIPAVQVNGIIYKVDASGEAAANVIVDSVLLTAAKGDLTIAYNDAAGRTPIPTGPFLNPGAGNIGGLNLVPGLYKFTGGALISGADVTLTGGPNDVWIFQIATDLIVEAGVSRKVILAGGALARNVFWQVGTSATLGVGSSFKGTILADQSITLQSGSTMEGRALAFSGQVAYAGSGGSLPTAAKAINPTPANGATGQVTSVDISWQNGGGATSYDVYFGTNAIPTTFKTNQTATSFEPGTLVYSNAYYWRIDSKNAGGTITGDIWSFTTANSAARGTLQFNTSTSSVNENSSSFTVTVTRLSGSFGAASVDYATANGTATAGSDYTAVSGTLNWTNGQTSARTFVIPVLDDLIYEGNETFTVALTNATGASLGFTVLKTVTIKENDVPAETVVPSISITVPTTSPTYTSLTNLLTLGGTAADNIGVVRVVLLNNRDVSATNTAAGTTSWTFTGLPLFQGTNIVTAIAYDASGNSATDTVKVVYSVDANYDDMLRSGNIVQEIVFPDNLIPGETVTVQWKVLSYVPIVSRIYAGIPGGWFFYQNGTYKGSTVSAWNLYGRPANLYSFECAWVVPQKSGDCDVWFNVAQMDADQFMIPVIPDGVDSRPDPAYPKLIKRTILAGGTGAKPVSDPDTWDKANIFETIAQHKARSAVTITSMTMPDNLTQNASVVCEWKVQSYIDVDAEVLVLNLATSNVWTRTPAVRIGTPTTTTFYFSDRVSGQKFYAKEYTFRATLVIPPQPGDQQIYFRSRPSGTIAAWMAENLSTGVDPRPVQEKGMYGRMIERTINP